ncbi:MAG: methionyl-tRNA formyltransferase [Saprospiraceae bacterium]|nr:methionyl-tRNA formyltransferase [Saprospiraceae bacterium]
MGTPAFAVPTLRALNEHGEINITGVVTALDKLGGRGRKELQESEVKRAAIALGLPIMQPKNLKSDDFNRTLRNCNPDLIVVVAFRMLPEKVWSIPRLGTINLHASLLPSYRGAAPINWAIINGEVKTGLTTFFIDRTIDTGHIIDQVAMDILEEDSAGQLHDRMMVAGAGLTVKTVLAIKNGTFSIKIQDDHKVSKAPKIFVEDCEIDFSKKAADVYNLIRGLSPYPGAWFTFHDQVLKIYAAKIFNAKLDLSPGVILSNGSSILLVGTEDYPISLEIVQLEGRKRMSVGDFLNGFRLNESEITAELADQ